MKKMIAYCGLDCGKCDALLATVNNDDALREKTARLWTQLNGTDITPDMINCEGCKADGVKTPFCESICGIRRCASERQVDTCGDCPEMETCGKVGAILRNNPGALRNLTERRNR